MNHPSEYLKSCEATYLPSAELAEKINQVTMVPLIGPAAIGKSACMDYVSSIDSDFGRVQSFTTRPRRSEEAKTEYRFIHHDERTVAVIADKAQNGSLVQFAVHPTTGFVYGSELCDYSRSFMMLDTLANGVSALRRLPFRKLMEITLVAEPEEWLARFQSRNADENESKKRISEAYRSLEWSLDQGEAMAWVCNQYGKLTEAGEEIHDLAKGLREPNIQNRKVGERMLQAIRIF